MNAWWQYFWPLFAAGAIAGLVSGLVGFRDNAGRRQRTIAIGAAAAMAMVLLWHGPFGGSARFAGAVERQVHFVLNDWEMGAVTGRLQRGPLTRRLELRGPGDAFQRRELSKLMELVPGVASARWSKGRALPLLAEGTLAAMLGFLAGLLAAYLLDLRRRHNAQWTW